MSRSCGRRLADAERRSTCIYAARTSAVARICCYGSASDWCCIAKAVKSWSEKVARALAMAKAVKSWQLIRVQGSPLPAGVGKREASRGRGRPMGVPARGRVGKWEPRRLLGPGAPAGRGLGCRRVCWAREARAASVECGVQHWRQWDRRACSTDGTHGNGWAVPKSPVRLDGNMRPSKENPWQRPSSRT